jgi:hypothetical protein
VLSVTFANSRGKHPPPSAVIAKSNNPKVKQELGKEGVLPWSHFWASDKPYGTPAAALFLHWVFSVVIISAPSNEDAYNFFVWIFTYSQTWVSRTPPPLQFPSFKIVSVNM